MAIAERLGQLFEAHCRDSDGRIRVEDLLSAASAACGEACLAATGLVDPNAHALTPGSSVFSDAVNGVLSHDVSDWPGAGDSVLGQIRTGALAAGYPPEAVPALDGVYRLLAGGVGSTDWGWVPLSVGPDHRPRVQPLRDAFELRTPVAALLDEEEVAASARPIALAAAVVVELGRVREAIDPAVALSIVFETVNGMAKTAPMTPAALREAGGS